MNTPAPIELSVFDAAAIVGALRKQAACERADAVGKIHNAKIGRLEEAAKLEEIAERVEAWQWAEQERQNERARPKHRPMSRTKSNAF
jgi:hypothetical protein